MKRFSFRLESVLKLRGHKEEEWRNKLAAAQKRCAALEQEITMLAEERVAVFSADAGDNMSFHLSRSLYLGRIEERSHELRQELQEAMAQREVVAEDYRKVRREYEAVRRLKEKKYSEYRKAWFAEEAKEIDDIANSRVAGGAHG
jgi:flagellar FliJ protein